MTGRAETKCRRTGRVAPSCGGEDSVFGLLIHPSDSNLLKTGVVQMGLMIRLVDEDK